MLRRLLLIAAALIIVVAALLATQVRGDCTEQCHTYYGFRKEYHAGLYVCAGYGYRCTECIYANCSSCISDDIFGTNCNLPKEPYVDN